MGAAGHLAGASVGEPARVDAGPTPAIRTHRPVRARTPAPETFDMTSTRLGPTIFFD